MNRPDYTSELIASVRRTAFAGSPREVPLDQSLTEGGLGLDSMAMVELITDLEQRFEVQIFESEWLERGDLTVRSLSHYLETGRCDPPTRADADQPSTGSPGAARAGTGNAIQRAISRMGRFARVSRRS